MRKIAKVLIGLQIIAGSTRATFASSPGTAHVMTVEAKTPGFDGKDAKRALRSEEEEGVQPSPEQASAPQNPPPSRGHHHRWIGYVVIVGIVLALTVGLAAAAK